MSINFQQFLRTKSDNKTNKLLCSMILNAEACEAHAQMQRLIIAPVGSIGFFSQADIAASDFPTIK
jgi:hypothetical protein